MTTATEQAIRKNEEDIRVQDLQRRFEWFVKKWSPTHRRAEGKEGYRDYHPAEFEADLFMLIRAVQTDASRPFEAILSRALANVPLAPLVIK